MTFDHPFALLLIAPLAAGFWLIARRSHAPLSRDQFWQSLALRCIAAAAIAIALAGPQLHHSARRRCVVFLVDMSRSISPASRAAEFGLVRQALAQKPRGASASVIGFASAPDVLVEPSVSPAVPNDRVDVDAGSTDIGAAIQTADAVAPRTTANQIVLLTDGNETTGSAAQAAAAAGMSVNAVSPSAFLGNAPQETSVASVDLPSIVHSGEPLLARAVIVSTASQKAKVTLKVGDAARETKVVALSAGRNPVSLPVTLTGSGLRSVEVDVDAPEDTLLENNRGVAMTRVVGPPRILYLTDNASSVARTLQRSMAAQSIQLDLKSAIQAPDSVAGFAAYDAVILSNTPAGELSLSRQIALQTAVRDFGVGLGMVGGVRSYIGGNWANTPVEESLPVWMRPRIGMKMPAADVVIVLDASGSMGEEEHGVEKVQLAARAAVSLLSDLQPNDRVAVLAVTEVPKLVLPFSKPKDALAAKAEIEGVEAGGGGIYCLVGLEAAYDMLDSSKAPIKHVIICPDTNDSEQQAHCVALAQSMRTAEHITTSVCGIGEWGDSDVGFQQALAKAGGGQLYVVDQASELPSFFTRDVKHFQAPPYVVGAFLPRVTAPGEVLAGFDTAAEPPLLGYNIVTAKAGATVAMRAPTEPDPILAYRSYGLGRTFAFTSDETDHWAAKWLPWGGYDKFWAQLLRWTMRGSKPADFQAFADIGPASSAAHIVVDAFTPAGSFLNGAEFTAAVAGPSGSVRRITLQQTAPGRYEAAMPASDIGAYLITVERSGDPGAGSALLGVSRPYSAEYAQALPNLPLLRQLGDETGGRILPSASAIWSFPPPDVIVDDALAPLFLLLGVLVFVLDVAWRRLGLRIRPDRLAAPIVVASAGAARMGRQAALRGIDAVAGQGRQNHVEAARKATAEADEVLLSRPVGERISFGDDGDADSFPLVASLDERRRRQKAQHKDG